MTAGVLRPTMRLMTFRVQVDDTPLAGSATRVFHVGHEVAGLVAGEFGAKAELASIGVAEVDDTLGAIGPWQARYDARSVEWERGVSGERSLSST